MKIVTFKIAKNKRGKWYWKLVAGNRKILAVSEDYSSLQKAEQTVKVMMNYFDVDLVETKIKK